MAYNDDAVFTAATGYIFTGPVGTEPISPEELASFDPDNYETDEDSGWVNLGHTSEEELPEFGFEGGERETRGTWQKKNFREVTTDTPVDYVTVNAQQLDEETFALYYGSNSSSTPGVFGVSGSDVPAVERAFQLILVDGDNVIGFYAHKASLRRDEAIALSTDSFASLPIRATFMKEGSNDLFQWILPTSGSDGA